MARDTMIIEDEDKKYVGDDGAMLVNDWKWYQDEDEEDGFYYYFGSAGKAVKDAKKTIDGKTYFFDKDGHMLSGWIVYDDLDNAESKYYSAKPTDDADEYIDYFGPADYFCGAEDDGAMQSNTWLEVNYLSGDEYKTGWVRLGSNGKKVTEEKKINGYYYLLTSEKEDDAENNHEGLMKSGWQGNKYYGESDDGARKSGWFMAKSNFYEELDDDLKPVYTENSVDAKDGLKYHWYYGAKDGTITTDELKKINGKYYAFDNYGIMLSGLYSLKVDGNNKIIGLGGILYEKIGQTDEDGNIIATPSYKSKIKNEIPTGLISCEENGHEEVYFFGEEVEDGSMKTGTLDVTTEGDEGKTYSMTFEAKTEKKGQAYSGITKKAAYVAGVKVKASDEDKVVIYKLNNEKKWEKVKSINEIVKEWSPVDPSNQKNDNENKKYRGKRFTADDGQFMVITNTGAIVTTSTTKTNGDDYKIKLVKTEVQGKVASDIALIYYEI